MTATKQQEEVVMIDDPQAATLVTVTGWRSRDGRFYGDNEHAARWGGCTHVKCLACGNKRCPHATDHRNACTNSNDPGQPGSAYGPSNEGR
ncbi:hypothetical protein UFOVP935_22 [uncultured Caudovirales phage]|uniref:Uncharacterized protein n=1 Tax=uncultured Caudovirales phage TaxID=2100421 RepID=A0A6J5PR29_9CAUD|nr:hypothetical protein UFOVP935_22 [uncultured Caudovirales phage]